MKIKPIGSIQEDIEFGSTIPRFDARLNNLNGEQYINPFTREIGNKNIGRHIPLEREWE